MIHEGTLSFNRGLKLMLELFTDDFFRDRITIKIIGNVDEKEIKYFRKKQKEYDIDDSMVFFTGWVDYTELYNHLAGNIGLLFFEKTFNTFYGMPNKLFNYINAGLPILSTHCAESSDFIYYNKIGCIVERDKHSIKEGLIELITNYSFYLNNVKPLQSSCNWKNDEKKLISLYSRLTGSL